MVDCCAVETHDAIDADSSRIVASAFDTSVFQRSRSGEFEVFQRRSPLKQHAGKGLTYLLKPAIGVRAIRLINVPPEGWGYYQFDGQSCQIHPTNANEDHAKLQTVLFIDGQTVFSTELQADNPFGRAVVFTFSMRREDRQGEEIIASKIVGPNTRLDWLVPIGSMSGRCVITIMTRMAEGELSNHQAVASWLNPRFT